MVEFLSGVRGMCLNLEADNVCVSIFSNDHLIKEHHYAATACAIYVPCALGFSTAHV
jgi:F0F1-type ATP synthase alpha subunit